MLEAIAGLRADELAACEEAYLGGLRQPDVEGRAAAAVRRPEREPARGRQRVGRDVGASFAQRRVDRLAVGVHFAGRARLEQDVRAQQAEGAVVAHRPQHPPPEHALADLVGVDPADRDDPASARVQTVPVAQVLLRRVGEEPLRGGDEAEHVADRRDRLSGVVHEAPQLHARQPVAVDVAPRHRGRALEQGGALRPGMRREPEPSGGGNRAADLGGRAVAPAHRLVDAEGEVVVLAPGRHLLAHQQEDAVVPALVPARLGLERVVVGEQHHVRPGAFRRPEDLGHRPGPVREGGVQVDDAREVVEVRGRRVHRQRA